jgi:CubicO group peptidase (beta-lactamase class C family)
MTERQLRVLYRDFLFSIVDRELLSTYAKGDASQLLLQLVALFVCLSVCFCLPVFSLDRANATAFGRLSFAWSVEHFLIATTMLVVGLFAVLSWGAMFPGQRDVLVLGPLPIRAHTILLAKFAAVATALGLTVLTLHVAAGVIWPLALNGTPPGPVRTPRQTYDVPMSPVSAVNLQAVMDHDLGDAISHGPLAPGAGGGVSIGIYQRGLRRVFSYGAAASDSLFQIGSATKPFTGLLLAEMVERGVAGLDEPVRELIPSAGLARPSGDEISLLDLATHRSGLPPMPASFQPANPANPAADFDVARLYNFLRGRGVDRRADAPFVYSNLGFGLLGHALGQRAGVDYGTLLRQVIAGPLGMNDTALDLSPEQQRRLLRGHDDYGRPIPLWDFDVLAGAGGLHSTAPDMLKWLEANLHPDRVDAGTLSKALVASHRVHAPMNADVDIALAWWMYPDLGVFEHAGSLLGFTADTFFNPREDVAVVVLSNVGPATAVSAETIGEHIRARLNGTPAVSLAAVLVPPTGGVVPGVRLLTAYWITMVAAAMSVFGLAMTVQGVAAAALPRRHFVRVSSWLQLATFCLVVGTYFLQPMVIRPDVLRAAQSGGVLSASPSLWFLGLLQELSGSPALAPLARNAWVGLGLVALGTVSVCLLSYVRMLRQVAEQPDVAVTTAPLTVLPDLGTSIQTAVAQFSVRTIVRSAQHRMILAFYWGIAFAFAIVFMKSPRGQQVAELPGMDTWLETSVPVLVSSIVMMAFAVLAARLAFSMPLDLRANWIFRVAASRDAAQFVNARRWALTYVSVLPVCTVWAVGLFWLWPWRTAIAHLVTLGFLGLTFVEVALIGALKIPCASSYLPGKSHVNLVVCAAALVLLPLVMKAATYERDALQNPGSYATMMAALCTTWIVMRWAIARANSAGAQLTFDDEPAGNAVTIELWDSRFAR